MFVYQRKIKQGNHRKVFFLYGILILVAIKKPIKNMNKYKEAFSSAEQEMEEKSIEQLKLTIKSILQKKKDKEEKRDELDEEIKLLKQDIEDFKSGRLDKVKERHETNEIIEKIFPITINIIEQEIITKPWTWTYEISPHVYRGSQTSLINVSNNLCGTGGGGAVYLCSGTTSQAFAGGTYTVTSSTGTQTINL